MSYEFFGEHYELLKKVQQANPARNIVVITDQTHQDVLNTCMADFLRKQNKIYIVKTYDLSSQLQHDEFLDLAIYLDSDIIRDPATFDLKQLGAASSLELTGTKSVFLAGQGMTLNTPFYGERLQVLQKEFDETPISQPSVRGNLRIRLSKLNGVSVRILVGGITAEEKQTRRFLVEDAVLACKSALLKGFGFGGNISLFFAANSIANRWDEIHADDAVLKQFDLEFTRQVIDRLRDVYYNTFYCIISKDPVLRSQPEALEMIREALHMNDSRMYDVLERQFQSIEETQVLAPIDTDVQILKASVSIVGMLLSINQLI
jgi:chaperonin GroEL (HSP60 family)